MIKKLFISLLLVALYIPTAQATVITVNGDTTSLATWNRPAGLGVLSGVGTDVPYQVWFPTVPSDPMWDAVWDFEITSAAALFDTYIHLYDGAVDAANPLTNLVALDDDSGAGLLSKLSYDLGSLSSGNWNLVVTGFSNSDFGAYELTLTSVPVPTTLALFTLGLAGLGWSRRKKA